MSNKTKSKSKRKRIEEPVILSREEVKSILDNAKNSHDYTLFLLVYSCGLNIQTVLSLRIQDIEGKGESFKQIKIGPQKYSEEYYVALPDDVYKCLQAHWKTHQNTELLFPRLGQTTATQPESKFPIIKAFRQVLDDAGIINDKVGINALRHSRASHLRQVAIDEKTISNSVRYKKRKAQRVPQEKSPTCNNITCIKLNNLLKSFNSLHGDCDE